MRVPALYEKVRFVPSASIGEKPLGGGGKNISWEVTGKVTWIHPQLRFYVVTAVLPGGALLRECFKIT